MSIRRIAQIYCLERIKRSLQSGRKVSPEQNRRVHKRRKEKKSPRVLKYVR